MRRWGAGGAAAPPSPESSAGGNDVTLPASASGPAVQAASALAAEAEGGQGEPSLPPTQTSSVRRRWRGGAGAHSDTHADSLVRSSQDEARTGAHVGFFFGQSEEEVMREHAVQIDEAESIVSLPHDEAHCTSCGFLQGISASALDDLDTPVPCDSCGDTKPSKAWLWHAYPDIPLTQTGTAYHTPHYCYLLSDAAMYPIVKDRILVMHLPPPPSLNSDSMIPARCPFGEGHLIRQAGWMKETGLHYLHQDRLRSAGSRWTFDIAQATGPSLVSLGAQQTVMGLLKATRNGLYAPLGPGLFDDLFQNKGHIAAMETELPMPRMHPVHPNPADPPKPPGESDTASPNPSPTAAGGGPSPRSGAGEGGAPSPTAGSPRARGSVVSSQGLRPAEILQMGREKAEGIRAAYSELYATLQAQAAQLHQAKTLCCTPVDYLLQGSDGSLEVRLPTILKTLAAPLEQRLVWDALTGDTPGMLKHYFNPHTGMLNATTDPLHAHPLGAFEPEFVPGCEGSWSERLTRTVCTTEGPSRKGGLETYQLDVHIGEVLFTAHGLFSAVDERVAQILRLHQEFRRVTKHHAHPAGGHPGEDGLPRGGPSPLAPLGGGGNEAQQRGVSRGTADRLVEDLIWHIVKAAASGAYGPALCAKGTAVEARWCECPTADGVLGRKTVAAFQDFLTFVTAGVDITVAPTWVDYGVDDPLNILPQQMLAAFRFWLGSEGLRLLEEHPSPALLSVSANITPEWWALAARPDVPVDSFGFEERVALQAVLACHFGDDALAVDGQIGRETISLLQAHLLNTREVVQENLMLPEHIESLEHEMRQLGAELEVLKRLADARRMREAAIEHEMLLMRQMLDEWLAIRSEGGGTPPPHISFGLVQRFPMPDEAPSHGLHDHQNQQVQQLRNKSPQVVVTPVTQPHDNNMQYMCKVFVRLRDGDGSGRYAARTEWHPMTKDYRVSVRSLVRLHLAKEPEALLVQVLQRGRAGLTRSTPCGYVTILPPFGHSPFEPGALQARREETWYPFGSEGAQIAGTLRGEAFWSQHDPAAPSRAPQSGALNPAHFLDLKTVIKEVVAGRMDPNDPAQQPLMKRLAERHGAVLSSRTRRRHTVQPQDGVLVGVLLPPRDVEPRPGLVSRIHLLQHRWHLLKTPTTTQRTDRQDTKLVGAGAQPVPLFPLRREWARDEQGQDPLTQLQGGAEGGALLGLTTEAWLARIRKAKAALVKGARRDVEILRSMVTQPVEEAGRNIFGPIAEFFRPIAKLRPYRKVVDESVVESTGEPPSILIYVKSGANFPMRCKAHLVEQEGALRLSRPRQTGFGTVDLDIPDEMRQRGERDDESIEADFFVEVKFGPCGPKRTKTTIGPDPLFFETLKLPLPVEDCKRETLSLIDDPVEIRVFDKVKVHRNPSDLHRKAEGATVNYYELKRYIGQCEIPFNTLYSSHRGTWEGTVTLNTPCVSLGYAHVKDAPVKDLIQEKELMTRESRISLYITLSPDMHRPEKVEVFDPAHSGEQAGIFWHTQRWVQRSRSQVRSVLSSATDPTLKAARAARVMGLVHDTEEKALLLTRFVRPSGLEPPVHIFTVPSVREDVQRGMVDPNAPVLPESVLARFVSLIPFVDNMKGTGDGTECWPTSAEFLATGAGDYDDHAVLLANLFTWLSQPPLRRFSEVWVVLGRTDTHTKAAFVLTRDASHPDRYLLWDPVSGTRYSLSGGRCPLRDVALLFNHTNILCNVQSAGQPHRMDWDVNAGRGWRQLFVGMQSTPTESCQSPIIQRLLPIEGELEARLQVQLVDQTKELLKDLRSPVRTMLTTFRNLLDIHGRGVLDSILLPAFEEARVAGYGLGRGEASGGASTDADGGSGWMDRTHDNLLDMHKSSLREGLASYDMHGFPLHFAWSDFGVIRKAIVGTGIYLSDPAEKLTEFAVGVYVKGYASCQANSYMSVWVYVATLKRNMSRWP